MFYQKIHFFYFLWFYVSSKILVLCLDIYKLIIQIAKLKCMHEDNSIRMYFNVFDINKM